MTVINLEYWALSLQVKLVLHGGYTADVWSQMNLSSTYTLNSGVQFNAGTIFWLLTYYITHAWFSIL